MSPKPFWTKAAEEEAARKAAKEARQEVVISIEQAGAEMRKRQADILRLAADYLDHDGWIADGVVDAIHDLVAAARRAQEK